MLRAAGERAVATGNVGLPVVDAVTADPPYDVLAVELSSFQLHSAPSVRPAAAAILNLAPDHLDWHGGFEAYAAAKELIWAGEKTVAIGNADDPEVAAPAGRRARPAGLVHAGRARAGPARRGRRPAGRPRVRRGRAGRRGRRSARPARTTSPTRWPPPRWPARTASTPAAVARGLRAFVPDPHRNEPVAESPGSRYVDDSKATNPHAALASLRLVRPGRLDRRRAAQGRAGGRAGRAGRRPARRRGAAGRRPRRAGRRRSRDTPPTSRWSTVSRTDDGAMSEVVRGGRGAGRGPATRCCWRRPPPRWTCSATTRPAGTRSSRRCARWRSRDRDRAGADRAGRRRRRRSSTAR